MFSFGVFFILIIAAFVTNGSCDDTTEANLLALDASGQLLAPTCLTQKLAKELKAIRAAYPAVSSIVYRPPWSPGVLIAKLSDKQLEKIRRQYGEVTSSPLFDDYKTLKFKTQYNPVVLGKELTSKKLVDYAEPDSIVGGGPSIQYNLQTGVYTFGQGWGDCQAGCINNHYWEFIVIGNRAILVEEYGSPLGTGSEAV